MGNFSIFNQTELSLLTDPFLPGAIEHITPIKYQALTPDIFAFLFRTTGLDDQDHYFVALEFDYVRSLAEVERIIQSWAASEVKRFIVPHGKDKPQSAELEDVQAPTKDPYNVVLAKVNRPVGLGYWSENIVLHPGDDLTEKLSTLSKQNYEAVQKFIARETGGSAEDAGLPSVNTSKYSISVYAKDDNSIELFFQ